MSSSAASGKRVTWRHPVVAGMTMVPNAVTRRFECDEAFEFLELEQAAIKEMAAQWAEAEEEKKQEEEKQVMAKVTTLWSKVYRKNKVKPPQANATLWPEKKKSLWGEVKETKTTSRTSFWIEKEDENVSPIEIPWKACPQNRQRDLMWITRQFPWLKSVIIIPITLVLDKEQFLQMCRTFVVLIQKLGQ